MNSRRKALRIILALLLGTVLLYSALPAQVDSLAKLGGSARMIYGHYDSQWKGMTSKDFRSDAFVGAMQALYEFDPGTDQPTVGVAAVVRDLGQELRAGGYRILAQIGDVVTMTVPVSALGQIAALDSVLHVDLAKIDHPFWHDVSVAETRAALARQAYGLSGQNVVVGTIDTGIDWRHDDFRKSDGKTRVKFLWDMSDKTGPEPSDQKGTGGTLYTEQQINDALAGSGSVAEADRVGHGTHVAGSAAGNGRATGNGYSAGTYTGMAPEADLVIVKGLRSDSGGFSQNDEIAALQFIANRAQQLGKPFVINMSLGGHMGSHDGTDAVERAIDNLVGPGKPGKVVCVSAGNEGASDMHASGNIALSSSQTVRFTVRAQSALEVVDIWYSGNDALDIVVTTPGGQSTPTVSPGASPFSGVASDGTQIDVESSTTNSLNNGREISIVLYKSGQAIASGTWSFQLRRTSGTSGRFDAYLAKNSRFLDHVDAAGHVGMPGTARNAITVASYLTKYRWTDVDGISRDYSGWGSAFDAAVFAKSPFSSAGPTRDGRMKPDIAAPGQGIASALSADADEGRDMIVVDGKHVIMQGTSMSSPHVTGAVALMLQAANGTLDAAQVRDYLGQTARTDDFTSRVPNYDFGYGKMDVYEAIRKIRGNTGSTPPTPSPVIISVEPGMIQRGTSTQIAISGLNFSGTLALDFSPSAGISVNSAGIASTTKISVNLNVAANATVGTYQVFVTTDGRRSNPGSFRIVAPDTPSPDTQDPYEPNDNLDTATPMPSGGRITARIYPKTDLDVFKFSATAGRKVTFDIDAATLTPPSGLDSILGIFDPYGNLLDFNDDDGRTLDSYLEWIPSVTGTYFVVVASYASDESGPTSTGNYVLKISGYAGDIRSDISGPVLESSQIEAPNFVSKTNELFASWQGIDPESGIDHYEFSVGSNQGRTDVLPWSRTNRNSVYLGGLNLTNGSRYYFNVTAYNGAGMKQNAYSPGTSVNTNLQTFPLYFPRVVAFPGTFTGFALVNTGITEAQITFKLYDNDGNLSLDTGVKNPTVKNLVSRAQLPMLSTELFSIPSSNSPGWVKVESTSPDVQGFYLYGSNNLSFLDGAEVSGKTYTDFMFHRIEDNGNDIFTSISLVNPNEADATVTLELRGPNGGDPIAVRSLTLKARRRLVNTVSDLFPTAGQVQGGTVRVRSNVGLVGFELFTSSAIDVGGMGPQQSSDTATSLVFAQMASLTGWHTEISLTNPNSNPVTVELAARIDDGSLIKSPATVTIPAGGQYRRDVKEAFGFSQASQVNGYATARVVSGSGGVFGNVVFGTTAGAIAALPIQTQATRAMVFSQVAQDNTYFTGLTLMNPGSVPANVRVTVYDASGGLLGSSDVIGARWQPLAPGEKRAKLIYEIVPTVLNRSAGYIVVTSDQPIIGFELFGGVNDRGDIPFLSAVPPQTLGPNPVVVGAVAEVPAAEPQAHDTILSLGGSGRDLGSLYLKLNRALKGKPAIAPVKSGWDK
jgi:subtilisin family serine protease